MPTLCAIIFSIMTHFFGLFHNQNITKIGFSSPEYEHSFWCETFSESMKAPHLSPARMYRHTRSVAIYLSSTSSADAPQYKRDEDSALFIKNFIRDIISYIHALIIEKIVIFNKLCKIMIIQYVLFFKLSRKIIS